MSNSSNPLSKRAPGPPVIRRCCAYPFVSLSRFTTANKTSKRGLLTGYFCNGKGLHMCIALYIRYVLRETARDPLVRACTWCTNTKSNVRTVVRNANFLQTVLGTRQWPEPNRWAVVGVGVLQCFPACILCVGL